MRAGLLNVGIPDNELEFFDIHIACDDAHALALETVMMSYADRPGWFEAPARWIARSTCGPSCSIRCSTRCKMPGCPECCAGCGPPVARAQHG